MHVRDRNSSVIINYIILCVIEPWGESNGHFKHCFLTGRIWVTVRMEEYFRFDRKDMGHGPYGGIL